jgi:hypothetical protein
MPKDPRNQPRGVVYIWGICHEGRSSFPKVLIYLHCAFRAEISLLACFSTKPPDAAMNHNTHVTADVVPPSEVKDVEIEYLEEVDPVVDKRLLRKIDFRIIPVLIMLFAFSLIDRNIIATARVAGMGTDLNLVGNRYSVALLALFPLYILIELPTNFILRRISVKSFFFGMVLCWGVVALCHAFVQTYPQLVAVRVLLGLFEGSFQVSSTSVCLARDQC